MLSFFWGFSTVCVENINLHAGEGIMKMEEDFFYSFWDQTLKSIPGKITFDAFSEAMKYSAEELSEKADKKLSQNQKSSRLKGFF